MEVTSPSSADDDIEEQVVSQGATPVVGAEVTSSSAADDDREEDSEATGDRFWKLVEEGERKRAENDRIIAMFGAGLIGSEEAWKMLRQTGVCSD